MGAPLLADQLAALIQRALTLDVDNACTVFVDTGDALVFCTARIDSDGDIVITPVVKS